jgi:signal peptidase II
MSAPGSLWSRWWRTGLFFLVAGLVVLGDHFTKEWAKANLALGEIVPLDRFTQLTHVQNTGAAFGIFQEHTSYLTVASCIGVAVILVYAFYLSRRHALLDNAWSKAALGSVLGGTVGNLIERLGQGYVTDFILAWGNFPAFNVADASITTGVSIFSGSLIYLLIRDRQADNKEGMASQKG